MIHAPAVQLAPAAPAPPPAPAAVVGGQNVSPRVLNAAPMTRQEVAALRARGEKLSDQLKSADGRRKELEVRLRDASGADKAGLEQRIGVLDARLARLESDIDANSQLLASPAAALASTSAGTSAPFGNPSRAEIRDAIPIVGILSVFVFFPIAIAFARNVWRRGSVVPTSGTDRESAHRLERMEQAMDAIAIEIERVSEGQRFVTRLLGDQRNGTAIGAAQSGAEAGRVPVGEKTRL